MKKKMLCPIVIVIAFLICCIVYFKPLSLSDVAEADNQMKMIYSQIGVENGEAYIDSVNYQDITIDQKNAILSLLDKYTYRRTVGTLFSNGSTSDLGNKTLSIYVYDDDLLINYKSRQVPGINSSLSYSFLAGFGAGTPNKSTSETHMS